MISPPSGQGRCGLYNADNRLPARGPRPVKHRENRKKGYYNFTPVPRAFSRISAPKSPYTGNLVMTPWASPRLNRRGFPLKHPPRWARGLNLGGIVWICLQAACQEPNQPGYNFIGYAPKWLSLLLNLMVIPAMARKTSPYLLTAGWPGPSFSGIEGGLVVFFCTNADSRRQRVTVSNGVNRCGSDGGSPDLAPLAWIRYTSGTCTGER